MTGNNNRLWLASQKHREMLRSTTVGYCFSTGMDFLEMVRMIIADVEFSCQDAVTVLSK